MSGLVVFEAGSMEEAVEVASKWPSAPLGTIEVRPILEELRTASRYR